MGWDGILVGLRGVFETQLFQAQPLAQPIWKEDARTVKKGRGDARAMEDMML